VLDATSFQYFDVLGNSLGSFPIPASNNGLSFLGVSFDSPIVRRVRIVYGNSALGPNDGNGTDVAVMDDFIYGEPQAVPERWSRSVYLKWKCAGAAHRISRIKCSIVRT
jgi:hypothetical protein